MYTGRLNTIVNAQCPYYQSEFRKSITCEYVDNASATIRFESEDEKDAYIRSNCLRYPNWCPLSIGMDEQEGEK